MEGNDIFMVTRGKGKDFRRTITLPTTQNKNIKKNNLEYGFTTAHYEDQGRKTSIFIEQWLWVGYSDIFMVVLGCMNFLYPWDQQLHLIFQLKH